MVDPGAERQFFKANVSMMDMKEWLLASGSHSSDTDCQTSKATLCPQLDCAHTLAYYLHLSPVRAPISSVPLWRHLGIILTESLVKCYCGFPFPDVLGKGGNRKGWEVVTKRENNVRSWNMAEEEWREGGPTGMKHKISKDKQQTADWDFRVWWRLTYTGCVKLFSPRSVQWHPLWHVNTCRCRWGSVYLHRNEKKQEGKDVR